MQLVFVADTTLFHVAAAQLGDATQWFRIAALNGINDPMLRGVVQLLLPPYDPSATGGLPGQ
jgi:hypothetical protein